MGFEASGDPKWLPLFEVLRRHVPGDVIGYDELLADAGMSRDVVHRHVTRATRELERVCQRTVRSLPGVGYQVASAGEHEVLAARQLRLARRRVRRSAEIVNSANPEELDVSERRRLENLQMHVANVQHELARRPRGVVGE